MGRGLVKAMVIAVLLLLALPAAAFTDTTNTRITSGPTGVIHTDSATFTFTSPLEGGFECRLDSGNWAACNSPKIYSSLADGWHVFKVRALNRPDHSDPTPSVAIFKVETEPPNTTIISGPSDTIATGEAAFAFKSSQSGGFECRLDSPDWLPCTSPQSYTSLANGPHTFEVRAVNELDAVDPTPAAASFVVAIPVPLTIAAPQGPPLPVAGESFNLELIEGNVELICPGENDRSRLIDFKQIPMGCLINTRNGEAKLTSSKGSSGELQDSHFWGGIFIASQEKGDNEDVDLKLAGKRMCERRGGAKSSTATISRGRRGGGRKLWGSGKGNYQTSGSYGSATVVGTTWLVVDRCDSSTLFKVTDGTVWVRDFIRGKTIVLEEGEQYIAKALIPRLDPDLWN
jgi:hypothetical protein